MPAFKRSRQNTESGGKIGFALGENRVALKKAVQVLHPLGVRRDCDGVSFRLEPKLPAGGRNVVSFFAAQSGDDAMLAQDGVEALLSSARRPRPLESFD